MILMNLNRGNLMCFVFCCVFTVCCEVVSFLPSSYLLARPLHSYERPPVGKGKAGGGEKVRVSIQIKGTL